jgi:hypothetical protein
MENGARFVYVIDVNEITHSAVAQIVQQTRAREYGVEKWGRFRWGRVEL